MRIWVLVHMLGLVTTGYAQSRNENWVFGEHTWFSFATDSAVQVPCTYAPSSRCANISDTLGQLTLIADDQGIRNGQFALVQGGSAAEIGWPLEQSNYLILPKPMSYGSYYVISTTREATKQAGVVEVNMDLNGGSGAVVGPVYWFASGCTAKLTATPHANGIDYWIALHQDGTNGVEVYRLSSAGIVPTPIVSFVGQVFQSTSGPTSSADFWGQMKFSADGGRLAFQRQVATDTVVAQVFDFDNGTGLFSYRATLDNRTTTLVNGLPVQEYYVCRRAGGLEFDLSGRYLYTAHWDSTISTQRWVQFDIEAGEEDDIQFSAVVVTQTGAQGFTVDPLGPMIQAGSDGRIYLRIIRQNPSFPILFYMIELPTSWAEGGSVVNEVLVQLPPPLSVHGFPNICRRYNDSEPAGLAMNEEPMNELMWSVRTDPSIQGGILISCEACLGHEAQVRICNALGQVLHERGSQVFPSSVYISSIPGLYFVSLTIGTRVTTRRIILI